MIRVVPINNIYITRGDYARIPYKLTDQDGNEYTPEEGDRLVLTVKTDTSQSSYVLQKEIKDGALILQPEDTEHLAFGRYAYDVELRKDGGIVHTVSAPHIIKICKEVNT